MLYPLEPCSAPKLLRTHLTKSIQQTENYFLKKAENQRMVKKKKKLLKVSLSVALVLDACERKESIQLK